MAVESETTHSGDGMMRAVYIEQYSADPDAVRFGRLPIPEPGPSEVLVQVACAGINFMDVHTRMGKYGNSRTYQTQLPCTLGMEGSGTVIRTGRDVQRFKAGDRVAWCISWGSYAEYACVPEHRLVHVPDGIPFDLAAASVFQGSTAHYLINDVAQMVTAKSCIVHAASGMIGQILVQLARAKGMTIFATTSTPEKGDVARQQGATHVMRYDGFADKVLALTNGAGVDVVFDSVGKDTLRESFRCTRKRGLVINYGSVSGGLADLDPIELGESGSLFLTRPRLGDHLTSGEMAQSRADDIFNALQTGELKVPIEGRYALDDVLLVHDRLLNRQQVGKAVVTIA